MSIDELDTQLLEELRANSRAPIVALSEKLHVSRPAIHARLNRLTETGTITASTVKVDHKQVGLPIAAIISVDVRRVASADLLSYVRAIPLIQWASFVSGDHDMLILARATSVDELRDEVVWHLRKHPAVQATRTQLVLSEIVDRPFLLPTDRAPEPDRPAKAAKKRPSA